MEDPIEDWMIGEPDVSLEDAFERARLVVLNRFGVDLNFQANVCFNATLDYFRTVIDSGYKLGLVVSASPHFSNLTLLFPYDQVSSALSDYAESKLRDEPAYPNECFPRDHSTFAPAYFDFDAPFEDDVSSVADEDIKIYYQDGSVPMCSAPDRAVLGEATTDLPCESELTIIDQVPRLADLALTKVSSEDRASCHSMIIENLPTFPHRMKRGHRTASKTRVMHWLTWLTWTPYRHREDHNFHDPLEEESLNDKRFYLVGCDSDPSSLRFIGNVPTVTEVLYGDRFDGPKMFPRAKFKFLPKYFNSHCLKPNCSMCATVKKWHSDCVLFYCPDDAEFTFVSECLWRVFASLRPGGRLIMRFLANLECYRDLYQLICSLFRTTYIHSCGMSVWISARVYGPPPGRRLKGFYQALAYNVGVRCPDAANLLHRSMIRWIGAANEIGCPANFSSPVWFLENFMFLEAPFKRDETLGPFRVQTVHYGARFSCCANPVLIGPLNCVNPKCLSQGRRLDYRPDVVGSRGTIRLSEHWRVRERPSTRYPWDYSVYVSRMYVFRQFRLVSLARNNYLSMLNYWRWRPNVPVYFGPHLMPLPGAADHSSSGDDHDMEDEVLSSDNEYQLSSDSE